MTPLGAGPTQRMMLLILGDEGALAPSNHSAWTPLREDQVQPALWRMAQRGWVEPVRFEGSARLWSLTDTGREVLERILDDSELDTG